MKEHRKKILLIGLPFIIVLSFYLVRKAYLHRSPTGWAAEMLEIQTKVFNIESISNWNTVETDGLASAFFGERIGTRYYGIFQGDRAAFEATFNELERVGGRTLIFGVPTDGQNYSGFPWWQPNLRGQGYYQILNVKSGKYDYNWWVYLFDKGTNALMYSKIYRGK